MTKGHQGQEIEVEEPGGAGMQKMTFTPPELSDEDQYAIHMPEYLRCDSCMAISYTMHKGFEKKHNNVKDQKWKMDQGMVMEILGEIQIMSIT